MRYRLFGRHTGLRVSEIALGAGMFGEKYGYGLGPEQARQVFDAYVEAGGRFIDTAQGYQGGMSETLVGQFVASRRDEFVIATKYGIGVDRTEAFSLRGNSRKALARAVDGSLRRLQTDYIDLYWTHGYDAHVPLEEVLAGLDDVVRAGKVLYGGLGNYPAWAIARGVTLAELRSYAPLTAVTFEYGVAERGAERELLPMAEALGVGVAAWSPLGGGFLTRGADGAPPRSHLTHWNETGRPRPQDLVVHDTVRAIAADMQVSPATVGYAWVLDRARRSTTGLVPIIGARTPEQVRADLAAATLRLSPAQLARLDEAGRPILGEPYDHNAHHATLFEAGDHYPPAVPPA